MKGITKIIGGLAIGTVNSVLGAGGGMIAVPMLRKSGMEQNRAQANAVALIMLLTAPSAARWRWLRLPLCAAARSAKIGRAHV